MAINITPDILRRYGVVDPEHSDLGAQLSNATQGDIPGSPGQYWMDPSGRAKTWEQAQQLNQAEPGLIQGFNWERPQDDGGFNSFARDTIKDRFQDDKDYVKSPAFWGVIGAGAGLGAAGYAGAAGGATEAAGATTAAAGAGSAAAGASPAFSALTGTSAATTGASATAADFAAADAAQLASQGLSQAQIAETLAGSGVDEFVANDLAQLALQGVPASQLSGLAFQSAGLGAAGVGYGAVAAKVAAGALPAITSGSGGAGAGAGAGTYASYIPALIAGGASLAGGALAANATGKAVDAQTAAGDRAVAEERRQFDQNREDLTPYRDAGSASLARLRTLMGLDPGGDTSTAALTRKFSSADLNADPVYNTSLQFGLDEGEKGINARAVQAGNYDSGATLKALTRFGNDYAGTKANESYGRFTNDQNSTYSKLMGTTGLGANATNSGVSAGTTVSGNIADTITGQGNAQAAGAVGTANAASTALGGVANAANQYQSSQLNSQILAAVLASNQRK